MKFTRQSINDFKKSKPYIKPDPSLVQKFKNILVTANPCTSKVGIAWRSGIKNPLRNLETADLNGWSKILTNPSMTFINLQYGDCEEELKEIERKFNIQIWRCPELDLKNDLDGVFALMATLDMVITTGTAVYSMAGAVGVETLVLQKKDSWTEFNLDYCPWYKNVKIFKDGNTFVPDSMPDLIEQVEKNLVTAQIPV